MPLVTKKCAITAKEFIITDADQTFYKKINVPLPTLCPEERQRRRLSFRNERNLYHRKCDFTGQKIISNISADKPFKVYEKEIWWSDKLNALEYGRPYDFTKPFFEQFRDLQFAVPRMNLFSKGGENCAYTNHATYNKNCYMTFNATENEDVHYCTNYVIACKNCIDCYSIDKCELLYNSFLCERCHSSTDLMYCKNCIDSAFLYDCRNCESCVVCWGLRNKKYCIENKQYSAGEYKKILAQFDRGSFKNYRRLQERLRQVVRENAIHRFALIDQSENCTGDYIFNSKNTFDSYYALNCRDCRYIYDGFGHTDSYDCYESAFEAERQYECYACNFTQFSYGCHVTHECHDMFYTDYCFNSHDCFGCISLKRNEYCILNKQYSREEYQELKPRIIEHMKSTGEWGEFALSKYSPFAYNESTVMDFLPLAKGEVLRRGLQWREQDDQVEYAEQTKFNYEIPDHIRDIGDDVCTAVLKCEVLGKYYKIIPQELKFYRQLNVPLPRRCFKQRYYDRLYWRRPRQLWERRCTCGALEHAHHAGKNCPVNFQTAYAPDRLEKIYCEKCYLESVY